MTSPVVQKPEAPAGTRRTGRGVAMTLACLAMVAVAVPAPVAAQAPGGASAMPDSRDPRQGASPDATGSGAPTAGNTGTGSGAAQAPSVIKPPASLDPGIRASVPNPTPVIPPPGSAGNQPNVQPR